MLDNIDFPYRWMDLIKALRKKLNVSMNKFARELGIKSPMTIYRWEKGQDPEHRWKVFIVKYSKRKNCAKLLEEFKEYRVRLQLHWYPTPQFGGWFYARTREIFKNHKLDVDIVQGGHTEETDPIERVEKGDAEFGICGALNFLKAVVEKGYRLKAVMVVFRRSPSCIMLSEGIKTVEDLVNKRIAQAEHENITSLEFSLIVKDCLYPRSPISVRMPMPFFAKLNELGKTKYGKDDIDCTQAYVFNEPLRYKINELICKSLKKECEKIYVFPFADELSRIYSAECVKWQETKVEVAGEIQPYGDILFTREELTDDAKECVQSFVSASLEGWHGIREAVNEGREKQVIEAIQSFISEQWLAPEPYHQLLALRLMFGLNIGELTPVEAFPKKDALGLYNYLQPTDEPIGSMLLKDWRAMLSATCRRGVITKEGAPPVPEDFCDSSFVDNFYDSK